MTYLLQVSTCWILFYGIYMLFLQKETFFAINRYYLLSALGIGLMIPLIGGYLPANQASTEVYHAITQIAEIEIKPQIESKASVFSWLSLLNVVYVLGASVVFSRFIFGLTRIYAIYKNGTKTRNKKYTLVESTKYHLPFSFFHFIFISKELPLNKDVERVLKHEELHANQWHSLDIVFTELLQVFFWFNPILIFYKNALKQSHEFLADAYVTKDHNRSSYGQLLLRQSTSGLEIALANHFFHSQIKKRITMMYKEKSKRPAMVKYLAAIPVLIAMLIIFSSSQNNDSVQNQDGVETYSEKQGDPIFKVVEEMPRFPGCEDMKGDKKEKDDCARQKLLNFIYQNMTYPAKARNADIQGMCVVQFVVEKDGKISSGKITREIGGGCGHEALRVVNSMPDWTPGYQKGKAVRVQYTLPVKFKLEGEKRENKKISNEQKNFMANVNAFGKKSEKATKENLVIHKDHALDDQAGSNDLYKVVEEMPRFPGCENVEMSQAEKDKCSKQKMLEFIYTNIKYPKEARTQGVDGIAIIQMIIEKDGSVTTSKIVRDPGAGTGLEAKRVIDLMPKWIPGKQGGKHVRVIYTLPIKYKMDGDDQSQADKKEECINPVLLVAKNNFRSIENVATLSSLAGLHSNCKIKGYRLVHIPKDEDATTSNCKTESSLSDFTKKQIQSANVGDSYFLEGIKLQCPREPKDPGSIQIKIISDDAEIANTVADKVDQKPLFPNTSSQKESTNKLLEFVFSNVTYPKIAAQNNVEGVAIVNFVIGSDGKIHHANLKKSLGWGIDESVLEMVDKMAKIETPWTPATLKNKNVNFQYQLPVKFKLQEEQKEEAKSRELKLNKLNISPNPSDGLFNLVFDINDKSPADITFYSLNGQVVKTLKQVNVPFVKSIDLTQYRGQTILMNITQNDKAFTEKILIQ